MRGLNRTEISGAMLLVAAVALAGCWGDGTGYDVRIDNLSSGDVVVTVEGKDYANDSTVERSFLAGAGAESAVTPWSYLDFGADGYLPGTVRLFTLDCAPIAEYSVDAGSYIITVESSGPRIDDNGGHFADATPNLPPATRRCS